LSLQFSWGALQLMVTKSYSRRGSQRSRRRVTRRPKAVTPKKNRCKKTSPERKGERGKGEGKNLLRQLVGKDRSSRSLTREMVATLFWGGDGGGLERSWGGEKRSSCRVPLYVHAASRVSCGTKTSAQDAVNSKKEEKRACRREMVLLIRLPRVSKEGGT